MIRHLGSRCHSPQVRIWRSGSPFTQVSSSSSLAAPSLMSSFNSTKPPGVAQKPILG